MIFKYPGGKRNLLPKLREYVPERFVSYHEPFFGGGALFFDMIPKCAYLSDENADIIRTYRVVRDNPDRLISELQKMADRHGKDYFYEVRGWDRQTTYRTPVEWTARAIYLNRTCYNGLYRVNSKGEFNAPFGRYESPDIVREEVIHTASKALQGVELAASDFERAVSMAGEGSFVYFDPPYYGEYTGYTAGGFDLASHQRLARVFRELDSRGCICVLSSSVHTAHLYEGYNVDYVLAGRSISSSADGRGKVREIIVWNRRA